MAKTGPKAGIKKKKLGAAIEAGPWATPPHLDFEEAAEFERTRDRLAAAGQQSTADPEIAVTYAVVTVTLRRATMELSRDGLTLSSEHGLKAHPAAAILNTMSLRQKALSKDLRLGEAAETKANPGADKWGGMLEIVG